jgi:hypothetical protein
MAGSYWATAGENLRISQPNPDPKISDASARALQLPLPAAIRGWMDGATRIASRATGLDGDCVCTDLVLLSELQAVSLTLSPGCMDFSFCFPCARFAQRNDPLDGQFHSPVNR